MRQLNIAPRPYIDETIPSWFSRLAAANHLEAADFKRGLFKWYPLHDGCDRLDLRNLRHISFLEFVCWLEPGELSKLQYPTRFSHSYPRCAFACPECFVEDISLGREPHWRRAWLSPLAMVCFAHQVPLVDGIKVDSSYPKPALQERLKNSSETKLLLRLQAVLEGNALFQLPGYWGVITGIMRRIMPRLHKGKVRSRLWPSQVFVRSHEIDPEWWEVMFGWKAEFDFPWNGFRDVWQMRTVSYRRLLILEACWILFLDHEARERQKIHSCTSYVNAAYSDEDMFRSEHRPFDEKPGENLFSIFEGVDCLKNGHF